VVVYAGSDTERCRFFGFRLQHCFGIVAGSDRMCWRCSGVLRGAKGLFCLLDETIRRRLRRGTGPTLRQHEIGDEAK